MTIEDQVEQKSPQFKMIGSLEQEAVREVIRLADQYGYGNMMSWLLTAWNMKLLPQMPDLPKGELPIPEATCTPYQITLT